MGPDYFGSSIDTTGTVTTTANGGDDRQTVEAEGDFNFNTLVGDVLTLDNNNRDDHFFSIDTTGTVWNGPIFLGTLFPLFYRYYFLSLPIFITFSSSFSFDIFNFEINSYGVRYRSEECILFWL